MERKHKYLWLLNIILFLTLYAPNLLRDGMFSDGLLYATLANNMAHGIGSFWFPQHFSGAPVFHSHPPLAMGIEAVFFNVLGDGMWVERLYCFLTLIVNATLILNIWKYLFRNSEYRNYGWLPVLLWLIHEDVFLSFRNNYLECTMGIFILTAVRLWLPLLNLDSRLTPNNILKAAMGGILIGAAFLSKGPPSLFPLVLFPLAVICLKGFSFKKGTIYSLIVWVACGTFLASLMLSEDAKESIGLYLQNQVFRSINDAVPEAGNIRKWHGHILVRWVIKMSAIFGITVLMLALFKFKYRKIQIVEGYKGFLMLFISLGLAGTLPFTLTLKQASYYLIPAIPFFTIAIGIALVDGINKLMNGANISGTAFKVTKGILFSAFATVLIFDISQIGKTTKKYRTLLADIHKIGKEIPSKSKIKFISVEDNAQLYLSRYYYSIPENTDGQAPFLLANKENAEQGYEGYEKHDLDLSKFTLFKKKE